MGGVDRNGVNFVTFLDKRRPSILGTTLKRIKMF